MNSFKNIIFDKSLIKFNWNSINFKMKNAKVIKIKKDQTNVYLKYSLEGYWINCVFGIIEINTQLQDALIHACNYLFKKYVDVFKVTICIWEDDQASKDFLTNIGFEQEVIIRDYIIFENKKYSIIIMSIFREDKNDQIS